MVHGAWYMVRGTWYVDGPGSMVHGTCYMVHGTARRNIKNQTFFREALFCSSEHYNRSTDFPSHSVLHVTPRHFFYCDRLWLYLGLNKWFSRFAYGFCQKLSITTYPVQHHFQQSSLFEQVLMKISVSAFSQSVSSLRILPGPYFQ